jgi:hypothetical protein
VWGQLDKTDADDKQNQEAETDHLASKRLHPGEARSLQGRLRRIIHSHQNLQPESQFRQ